MNCPRCTNDPRVSAYRGEVRTASASSVLSEEVHPAGVRVARCRSCRGAFVAHEDLVKIESHGREKRGRALFSGAAGRTWDPPTEAIACPSCFSETTRREWSIGTLLFVDVCVECRGVWLDGGELEAFG